MRLVLFAVWVGCNGGSEKPPSSTDSAPTTHSTDPLPGWCDTAIDVTYENWGRGFLTTHCQGCHASTTPNRYGAPEEASFDHEDDSIKWASRILVRVLDEETMPPAGGVADDDKVLLSSWLECAGE